MARPHNGCSCATKRTAAALTKCARTGVGIDHKWAHSFSAIFGCSDVRHDALLWIPIYSGRVFRREAGPRSDLKPATIPK
jgi:hypothetical protein